MYPFYSTNTIYIILNLAFTAFLFLSSCIICWCYLYSITQFLRDIRNICFCRKFLSCPSEQSTYISSIFSRRLYKHNSQLCSFLGCFICCYCASFFQVYLIPHDNYQYICTTLSADILHPLVDRFETWTMRYVINYNSNWWISNIRGNKCSKTFLTSGIPQLKPYSPRFQMYCFRKKINSNSRLMWLVKSWVHKLVDDTCFAYAKIAQKYKLVFFESLTYIIPRGHL